MFVHIVAARELGTIHYSTQPFSVELCVDALVVF